MRLPPSRSRLLALFLGLSIVPAVFASSPWPDVSVSADSAIELVPDPTLARADGATARWEASPGMAIELEPPAVAGAKGMDFRILYGDARPEALDLRVLSDDGETLARFDLFPDGKGWRRVLVEMASDSAEPVAKSKKDPRRIRLASVSGKACAVWLGRPSWVKNPPYRRTADPHCPSVYSRRTDPYALATREWLDAFRNPPAAGTLAGTGDAEAPGRAYDAWVFGSGNAGSGATAKAVLEAQAKWIGDSVRAVEALGMKRDGPWVRCEGKLPPLPDLVMLLTPIAMDWKRAPDAEKLERIFRLFDLVAQEGYAVSGDTFGETTMQFSRLKHAGYAHAVGILRAPLLAAGRLDAARRIVRWHSRQGEWDGSAVFEVNSDVLRGEAEPRFIWAFTEPDPSRRAFELRRMKTWLESCLTVTSNLRGLIKPDFTVNHHHNPYLVEYGPHALTAAATIIGWLEGSPWSVGAETKVRVEAVGDMFVDISRGFGVPISTRGRFPASSRTLSENLPFYLAMSSTPAFSGRHAATARLLLEKMASDAGVLLGKKATAQKLIWMGSAGMADMVDRLERGEGKAAPRTGVFPFNWGGVTTAKRDGWTAQVQGFNKWVFDFEAGNPGGQIENDWGRFLRYGTIELHSGADAFDEPSSGWALQQGWDWALLPGATTLRLSSEALGLPKPPAVRTHRLFGDRTFCGGVDAGAGFGSFALDLRGVGPASSLEARKSVFFARDLVICAGTRIRSSRSDVGAVTTLFQFGRGAGGGAEAKEAPVEGNPSASSPVRLEDPAGNAFLVIEGRSLLRRQGTQTGPTPAGKIATGDFDTAWIDHGSSVSDERYLYAIHPRVTGRTAEIPTWEWIARTETTHALRFPSEKRSGWIFFEATSKGAGEIASVDRPCQIWMEEKSAMSREVTVVDPDLGFPNGANLDESSEETSRPAWVEIDFAGSWKSADGSVEVRSAPSGGSRLRVRCEAGRETRFRLVRN